MLLQRILLFVSVAVLSVLFGTQIASAADEPYTPQLFSYVDVVNNPDKAKWVVVWTYPNGSQDWKIVAEAPRRPSGPGNKIRFRHGEVVFGAVIQYDDGRVSTQGNCFVIIADQDGWVRDGTVNPWKKEVDGLPQCAFSSPGSSVTGLPAPQPVACNGLPESARNPSPGNWWRPIGVGGWRVVEFWTNEPGKSQALRKLLLNPGDNPELLGGGANSYYRTECGDAAQKDYGNKVGINPVTLDQLKGEGLAR